MKSLGKVARKMGKSTQYAALCYRIGKNGDCEILLVTSRGTGRWIPPKGWPIEGLQPHESAAREALEEAGVKGHVHPFALGRYRYVRAPHDPPRLAAEAFIFPLKVEKRLRNFKEKGQRRIKWFSQRKAARLVTEPKLGKIIRKFDPRALEKG